MKIRCANSKVAEFKAKLFYNEVWYENEVCQ